MQKIVSTRMDRIITVSRDSAKAITKAFGVPPEKIRVVYNGLDSQEFIPLPGLPKKPKSLIFVGNSEDRKKGLLYLLQSLVYLPEEVTLTVVDGGAPLRAFGPSGPFYREDRPRRPRPALQQRRSGRRSLALRRLWLPRRRSHGL
jgi:glycosyltransferase involved in cell wall biosynthesis